MSDPSVQAMTWAQWLFEFRSLQKKEEGEHQLVVTVMKTAGNMLRETLVGVLGLQLFAPPDTAAEAEARKKAAGTRDPLPTAFLPAAFILGNHHLLEHHLEQVTKNTAAEGAINDTNFDAFSDALAKGKAPDFEAMLQRVEQKVADPNFYWNQPETQALLKSMGVKPRDVNAPAAPHTALQNKRGNQRVMFDTTSSIVDIETMRQQQREAQANLPKPPSNFVLEGDDD